MALADKGLATDKSRIKMRVLTTNPQENKCWYSPAAENRKSNTDIIEGMKRRFLKNHSSGSLDINARINCIIFYDAYSGSELERYKM